MNTQLSTLSTINYLESIVYDRLSIPEAPEILKTLCEINPDSEDIIVKLTNIINANPLLKRKFLNLSNSALFRGVVAIDRVKTAIIRLGITRVISLLIGITLSHYIQGSEVSSVEKSFQKYWGKASKIACFAYVISERKRIAPPEKAMLIGLLHNIGFLPVLLAMEKVSFLQTSSNHAASVIEEVTDTLTPSATTVTLEYWDIPSDVANPIAALGNNMISTNNYELSMLLKLAVTLGDSVEVGVLNEAALTREQKNIIHMFWPDLHQAREELIALHPTILQLREGLLR